MSLMGAALRALRTAVYRVASPFASIFRRPSGLPPLWLRRHAGPVRDFESSAAAAVRMLDLLRVLPPEGRILDFGCGPGSMALALEPRLGPRASYVGTDVHAPSIEWCRERFAGDHRYRFELARIDSPYASRPGPPMTEYRLPVADGSLDLLIAKSVFTHLLPHESSPLLAEIARALAAGGSAVVTAFLYEGGIVGKRPPAFPNRDPSGCVAWKRRRSPSSAVAYEKHFFDSLVREAGLTTPNFVPGFYPGNATRITGQDTLVLSR